MSKKAKRIIFYSVVTIIVIALLIFFVTVIIPWLFESLIRLFVIVAVLVVFAFALNH